MNTFAGWAAALAVLVTVGCGAAPKGSEAKPAGDAAPAEAKAAADAPPEVPREFRGVWIATVANIDWPSARGLPAEQQKAELLAILDKAVALNLNAIVLQVRPGADALYKSELEPWSAYLTGEQGKDPGYDPLAFAIEEAHRRGLELHAWFNPYRVLHPTHAGAVAENHISRTHPELVREYGKNRWLDPSEPQVQEHSLRVMLDVVRRYDIDGVHIDDYFYPYPEKDAAGQAIGFPDDAPWTRYQRGGGKLGRDDWRRDNVNRFVQRLYEGIKKEKRHVRFGISPFGIWQPGHPAHIKGMNQHDAIFADAKKWLEEGWCDYFTPQLYWPIRKPQQGFVALLEWWGAQNPKGRHIWPGLYTSRTADGSASAFDGEEVRYQVEWTRIERPEDSGHIHFSAKALMENRAGIADLLASTVYANPALPPATPWLSTRAPAKPRARLATEGEPGVRLLGKPAKDVRWYAVQAKRGAAWSYAIVPAQAGLESLPLPGGDGAATEVFVTAVSRLGMASEPLKLTAPAPAPATPAIP